MNGRRGRQVVLSFKARPAPLDEQHAFEYLRADVAVHNAERARLRKAKPLISDAVGKLAVQAHELAAIIRTYTGVT